MPRARSRSSRSACSAPARASASSSPTRSRVGGELLLGHAEAHAERDESGLRAVVQVPLDPAKLRVLEIDRAGPTGLERLDPLRHLGPPRRRRPDRDRDHANTIAIAIIGHTGQK